RDRLAEVEPDLVGVDIERGDELDVAHVVAAELHVHQARHALGRVGVAVELDALHEAARAVPDAGDRDADPLAGGGGCRTHALAPSVRWVSVASRWSAISSSINSRWCGGDWPGCARRDRV